MELVGFRFVALVVEVFQVVLPVEMLSRDRGIMNVEEIREGTEDRGWRTEIAGQRI